MAMVNGADDWALVVGIANYPRYGKTPAEPNNLRAPINDAIAMEKFLREQLGVKNITLLTSVQNNGAAWVERPPRPVRDDIDQWITDLVVKSDENVNAGKGPQVGRRLYLYFSGHGLAPEKSKRALVTSNALAKTFIDHVMATAWQDNLSNSLFFSEYVLWMDFCSQAQVTLIPSLPPFQITEALNPPAPQFTACAAAFPLQAIELPLGPGGEFHSVFTYELLRGLRGAAINPATGGIRTRDLTAYLFKAVAAHIDKLPLPDRTGISREPDFLAADDMEFVSPATAPATAKPRSIRIAPDGGGTLPDGTSVRVFDHARSLIGTVVVHGGVLDQELPPGLYKLDWGQGSRLIEITDEAKLDA
ncbi:MAG: hypothetical protein JWQ17_359 [Tardiphaga sp.]|jgi:hypothetical protein|nr:hypothetical protein [Tardiphaga sp.]